MRAHTSFEGFPDLTVNLHALRACFSLQEIETSEPCNCIHFSKSHVIYGTGKFYTLDIKQHTVKGWPKEYT